MSSTVRGYSIRDLTPHARAEISNRVVNFGKGLPATATGNLFSVTGVVLVTGLVGVVSTVLAATNVKPQLGVVGHNAAIAAVPAVAYNATAVGSVITLPPALGGALPAPVAASGAAAACGAFVVDSADITMTTDATVTGAITWILEYIPLYPKKAGSVAAV